MNYAPVIIATLLLTFLFSFKTLNAQWPIMGNEINGMAAGDLSAYSLSLSDDGLRIIIGSRKNDGSGANSGAFQVYDNIEGNWVLLGTVFGDTAGDEMGYAVAISGNKQRFAASAVLHDANGVDRGVVRIYEIVNGVIMKVGEEILGEAAGDEFGRSLALSLDGNTVAIGAIHNDGGGNDSGHARVFWFNGTVWVQLGSDINGGAAGDQCGFSLALSADGTTVAVASLLNDEGGLNAGEVRIFKRNASNVWVQLGNDLLGTSARDFFGTSVAISADGLTVAVGSDMSTIGKGKAQVFTYNISNTTWEQKGSTLFGDANADDYGYAVSLSSNGSVLAVGARQHTGGNGYARVFRFIGSNWVQIGADLIGEAALDEFGCSISLSANGGIVAVGAQANDSNGSQSGHARVFGEYIALPVELLAFSVTPLGDYHELTWQTAQEMNLQFFQIERSVNGKSFLAIGEVAANGSGSKYSFRTETAQVPTVYYRLKSVDRDGSSQYSGLRSVDNKAVQAQVQVYPTITDDVLNIMGASVVHIYSCQGQLMQTHNLTEVGQISLVRYPIGVYYIRGLDTAGLDFVKRVVKE